MHTYIHAKKLSLVICKHKDKHTYIHTYIHTYTHMYEMTEFDDFGFADDDCNCDDSPSGGGRPRRSHGGRGTGRASVDGSLDNVDQLRISAYQYIRPVKHYKRGRSALNHLSLLSGFESRPGHVRKLPVTWG